MPSITRNQRIAHKYHGTISTFTDNSSDYMDISLTVPGMMAIKIDPNNPKVGHLFGEVVLTKGNDDSAITIGTVVTDKKVTGSVIIVSDGSDDSRMSLVITNNVITYQYPFTMDKVACFINYGKIDATKNRVDTVTIS